MNGVLSYQDFVSESSPNESVQRTAAAASVLPGINK